MDIKDKITSSDYEELRVYAFEDCTGSIIDFEKLDDYKHLIKAETIVCTLGTTIKKAGSQEKFRPPSGGHDDEVFPNGPHPLSSRPRRRKELLCRSESPGPKHPLSER